MRELVGLRINNYEIISLIGEGGMGSVYLAKHPLIGRQTAIKVLHPEFTREESLVMRFMNEARAANAIRHPHLIDIIDVGALPDGTPYLMMEYLEGESLAERLRREPVLPLDQALEIAHQAADALEAAHRHDIVHRDLKPDNLFLLPDPNAPLGINLKVLDFGIAKLAGGLASTSPKTSTGLVMGTPAYMSPEQCRGIREGIDHRSDIYSLGIILFHMICGRPPYVSEGAGELMGMHMFGELPKPSQFAPQVPQALEQLLLHALARDPAARFQTMAEFDRHLAAVDLSSSVDSSSAALPVEEDKRLRSPRQQTTLTSAAHQAPTTRLKDAKTKVVHAKRRMVYGASAAVVVLGAVTAWLMVGSQNALPSKPVPTAASPGTSFDSGAGEPEKPATVNVAITTTPTGANVTNADNGELLGVTPYRNTFPRDRSSLHVVIAKAGFQSENRTISLSTDEHLDLALTKELEKPERRPKKAKPVTQPETAPEWRRKL